MATTADKSADKSAEKIIFDFKDNELILRTPNICMIVGINKLTENNIGKELYLVK